MDTSEKSYVEKRLSSSSYWQKMKFWWGKDTDQHISARSLTLLIFAVGVGIVWSTTTRTQVSDATAVTFSVTCFNPFKLYPLSVNIFRKWFASYFLFIHEHLIIMWSPTVNLIAVTTLLLMSGLHGGNKEYLRRIQIFYAVRISISLSEIFIQIGYFF